MVVLVAWVGAALGGGLVVAGLLLVVPVISGIGISEGGSATMMVLMMMVVMMAVVILVSLWVAIAGLGKGVGTMVMMRVVNLGVAVTMVRAIMGWVNVPAEWGTVARTRGGVVAGARLAIRSLGGTEIGGRVMARRGMVGRGIQL
jgi:hypothetical protein